MEGSICTCRVVPLLSVRGVALRVYDTSAEVVGDVTCIVLLSISHQIELYGFPEE